MNLLKSDTYVEKEERKQMSTPPQTLIEIDDSLFMKGYQEGRLRYFQEPSFFTDEELLTRLVQAFESSTKRHKARVECKEYFSYLVSQIIGEMSGSVIARQSYEGGMPNLQAEQNWVPAPQTLVVLSHPIFSNGYLEGRLGTFQKRYTINDDLLVMRLWCGLGSARYEQATESEREEMRYDLIGQLTGEMSAGVLPLQPGEAERQAFQSAFTRKVLDLEKERRLAIKQTLHRFWVAQEQLAHLLEADLFEEIITSCLQKRTPVLAPET
jgi:hypothetical protein